MNSNLPLQDLDSVLDEIVVLGFDGSFNECLINSSGINIGFNIREFENSFLAFQWLHNAVATQHNEDLPKAIVCEFGSLEEENFLLLQNVKEHSQLKYIPLIAMNRDGLNHKLEALKLGFDDYYDVPVHWQVLRDRVDFLTQFLRDFDTVSLDESEQVGVRISFAKRFFDIVFSLIAILAFSPVLILVALAIKLESRGPVIYRSRRVGTGYQVFEFLKFRSMFQDADQRLIDLQHLNQYSAKDSGALFTKINNDPRVTKTGRLIRKTSLDELPQLFNILKGDMSIVGNRPLPLYEAEQLTRDLWAKRFLAPAGLTGLWQVTKRGKNNMSTEERISLDVTYADHHSFWYDMKIIAKTPFAIIQEEDV
ncbi:MAG: sugar transferase [Saprospiraceae bacterium]|nr:sugar transferase [Saprospiraceae bacterium]MCF8251949.1 sugar transferase [Saprospiraceae bacterium]MCF8313647.1 sugar transferase [Saprospiraceae bacterium]MCF8442354.1 sugar transferase [Saprospiraceae bacterium]